MVNEKSHKLKNFVLIDFEQAFKQKATFYIRPVSLLARQVSPHFLYASDQLRASWVIAALITMSMYSSNTVDILTCALCDPVIIWS